MPFGKYQGTLMANVPDDYLVWFWEKNIDRYKKGKSTVQESMVIEYIDWFGFENLKP